MFERIKAISSSLLQLELAFNLKDGPMGVGDLAKRVGKSTAAVNHALIPMQEDGRVSKNSRDYHLTNIGIIQLAILMRAEKSIKALDDFREFWLKHDLRDIPEHLLARIGELEGSEMVKNRPDDMSEVLETFLETLRQSKTVHGISAIIMPGYVETTTEILDAGVEETVDFYSTVLNYSISQDGLLTFENGSQMQLAKIGGCLEWVPI